MKKLLAAIIAALMLLSLSACNREVKTETGGVTNYNETTTYEIKDSSGKVLGTLSYKAQGTDYAVITKYTPRISGQHSVIIPEVLPVSERTVIGIGSEAFRACTSVTSVTIPSTVEYIGDWAFYLCTSMSEIKIPENVSRIGKGAFVQCTSLSKVTFLGEKPLITDIGDYAFKSCTGLENIVIPEGVVTLGDAVFFECNALKEVTLPSTVESIGKTAFAECPSIEKITLGDNISNIGEYAFGTLMSEKPETLVYTENSTTDKTLHAVENELESDT